jgi:chromosome segregation protein
LYITELEVDNFKSFGKKTKIPFFEGFTVISGPNGSGKSNIIDSVLFCLTLSGARGLRAEKLTDLINLNTGKNTAEVSITFSEGTKIRRKIKRTPHGYYSYNYLNDRACKVGDIVEFLSRNGIKPEGYNVVMQGDITRITEMSDTERRKIIDEIAGVAEFDKKREQALSELEIVRERIEREELILAELENRIVELKEEKEQALKYRALEEELEHLKSCLSYAKLAEKNKELLSVRSLTEDQNSEYEKLAADRSLRLDELENLKIRAKETEDEINEKSGAEYLALLSEIEDARGKIRFCEQSIEKLNAEKERSKEAQQKNFADMRRAESTVKEISDKIRNLSVDRSGLSMELSGTRAELENAENQLSRESRAVEGAKDELFSLRERLDKFRSQRSDLLKEQDLLIEKSRFRTEEKERLSERLIQAESELNARNGSLEEYSELIKSLEAEKSVIDRELAAGEGRLFENKGALEKVRSELRSLDRELMRLEAQQQASGGPGGRAMDYILGMDGIYGTVAQLGRAPPEYTNALNIAAGGRIRSIVAESDSVASACISYLKDNRLGRMTFLPLNKLRAPDLPHISDPDVIGYAADLLEYDPLFDSVFRHIFGRTVVVKDMATARRMMGRFRMVTLDGDLIEVAGAMTGGSLQKKMQGFGVAADDGINALKEKISALTAEEGDLRAAVERYEYLAGERRSRRSEIGGQISKYSLLVEEFRKLCDSLNTEIAGIREKQNNMAGDFSLGAVRLEEIESALEGISEDIGSVEGSIESLKKKLGDTGIPELAEKVDFLRRKTADSERRLRNKDDDISDSQRERQHFQNRLSEFQNERERIESDFKRIDEDILKNQTGISDAEAEVRSLEEKKENFSVELNELHGLRDKINSSVMAAEKKIFAINSEMERIKIQVSSLKGREDLLISEIEELSARTSGVVTDMSLDEIEKGIEASERAIKRIGAVNMLAIEEYERVDSRIKERSGQKEVLSRERANIIERIEHYDKMKYDSFMEAYNAIDSNFRSIFARLTEGSGNLSLDSTEDPFSGGMTFAVQPRGKKVHLLSALSGGEKSLTTLAFIFSIQQYMPAPFYALDEVDMMLDGSNIERISNMISELSGNAQTICVSLRRPTIERADRIIGVTARPDKSTYVTGVKSNG